jgi:hypothetical protein
MKNEGRRNEQAANNIWIESVSGFGNEGEASADERGCNAWILVFTRIVLVN